MSGRDATYLLGAGVGRRRRARRRAGRGGGRAVHSVEVSGRPDVLGGANPRTWDPRRTGDPTGSPASPSPGWPTATATRSTGRCAGGPSGSGGRSGPGATRCTTSRRRLDPDSYFALARATYREMAAAGITTVGEFHYLHHQPDGTPYDDPNAMGHALVEAAREAGHPDRAARHLLPVERLRRSLSQGRNCATPTGPRTPGLQNRAIAPGRQARSGHRRGDPLRPRRARRPDARRRSLGPGAAHSRSGARHRAGGPHRARSGLRAGGKVRTGRDPADAVPHRFGHQVLHRPGDHAAERGRPGGPRCAGAAVRAVVAGRRSGRVDQDHSSPSALPGERPVEGDRQRVRDQRGHPRLGARGPGPGAARCRTHRSRWAQPGSTATPTTGPWA